METNNTLEKNINIENTFQDVQDNGLGDLNTLEGQPYSEERVVEVTKNEKNVGNIRNIVAKSLLCVSSLSGLLFSACSPVDIEPEKPSLTETLPVPTEDMSLGDTDIPSPILVENTPTETVIIPTETSIPTETPEPTATETPHKPESNIPKNIPTEKNELFDFRSTDLLCWNDYELVETETLDVSETVETAFEENHLYLMPTFNWEGAIDEQSIYKLTMPSGYTFNIKEKRLVKNSKGEMLTFGIVEDTSAYGTSRSKFVLLLNAKDKEEEVQGFVETKEKNPNIVTCINSLERGEIDRVKGSLLAFQRLSEYQEKIGGFKAGVEISLLDVFDPINSFKLVPDGYNMAYPVGTESVASVLNRLSQKEESAIEVVRSRQYFTGDFPGPFSMEKGSWSTAVGLIESSDFVFKIKQEDSDARYFLKIEPIFSNINIQKTLLFESESFFEQHSRIIDGATLVLVKELPEGQQEMINLLSEQYNQYIERNATVPMTLPQGVTMEKYYLSEGNLSELCGDDKVFPYIRSSKMWDFMRD